jgi:hypothetical protein
MLTQFRLYKKWFSISALFFLALVSIACSNPAVDESPGFIKVQNEQVYQGYRDIPFTGSGRVLLLMTVSTSNGKYENVTYEIGGITSGKLNFTFPKDFVISGTPLWDPIYSDPADHPGSLDEEVYTKDRTVGTVANLNPSGAQWSRALLLYDDMENGKDNNSKYWKYLIAEGVSIIPPTDNSKEHRFIDMLEYYYCDRAASVSGTETYTDVLTVISFGSKTTTQYNTSYYLNLAQGWNIVYSQRVKRSEDLDPKTTTSIATNVYSTSILHVNPANIKWGLHG